MGQISIGVDTGWHLLKNLRETVERILSRHHHALRQVTLTEEVQAEPPEETQAEILAITREPPPVSQARQEQYQRRERRLSVYQAVVEHHQAGMSLRDIAKAVGLDRRTVRRYLRAGRFSERAARRCQPSKLDPFREYLQQRWVLGCHNATQLFQEIKAQGFTGRPSIVYRALQGWRQPEATLPADGRKLPHPIPSPRQVSGWLLELANPPNDPQEALRHQSFITRLCERHTEINTARLLANEFIRLVRQRQAGALSAWLTQVKDSAIQELRSFATGLQQDLAAVSAALDLPWSNGQTEGQVNRLKCIKRMMYGRTSFELLRLRVLQPV